MFGWFKPVCPIDLTNKVWVEEKLIWLCEKFGTRRILEARRILPTREFFPEPYRGTPEDLAPLFDRVCTFMGANPSRFQLELFDEEHSPGILGLYERGTKESPKIWLQRSLLRDQESVIATLAHEVAHDLLLGAGLLTGEEDDHEQLTDLLPVALGMGTFHANTAVKDKTEYIGNMSIWNIRKSGYLTAAVCGYAMGVIEWLRHSPKPSVEYLGLDAAGAMQSGHRYLTKTGECLIDRNRPDQPVRLVKEDLEIDISGPPSRCLYLLETWDSDRGLSPRQVTAAQKCLRRPEPDIQTWAIWLLAKTPAPSPESIEQILQLLRSPHGKVSRAAINAISELKLPLDHVTEQGDPILDELIWLTRAPDHTTCVTAVVALGCFGAAALIAVPRILPVLVQSLARNSPEAETLFASLGNIVGSVSVYLEEHPSLLSEGYMQLVQEGLILYKSAGIR